MTLATHAIVGAAAASLVPARPVFGFCLGFLSHFLIDAIPHWHYPLGSIEKDKSNQLNNDMSVFNKKFPMDLFKMGSDVLLGMLFSFLFFQSFIGAVAGVLPDALQFVYMKWRREPMISLQRFHLWIHAKTDLDDKTFRGVSYQILIIFISVAIAKLF